VSAAGSGARYVFHNFAYDPGDTARWLFAFDFYVGSKTLTELWDAPRANDAELEVDPADQAFEADDLRYDEVERQRDWRLGGASRGSTIRGLAGSGMLVGLSRIISRTPARLPELCEAVLFLAHAPLCRRSLAWAALRRDLTAWPGALLVANRGCRRPAKKQAMRKRTANYI